MVLAAGVSGSPSVPGAVESSSLSSRNRSSIEMPVWTVGASVAVSARPSSARARRRAGSRVMRRSSSVAARYAMRWSHKPGFWLAS